MNADPIITADDVIRAGACRDGVMRVVSRFHGKIASAMPVSHVLKLVPKDDEHYVMKTTIDPSEYVLSKTRNCSSPPPEHTQGGEKQGMTDGKHRNEILNR